MYPQKLMYPQVSTTVWHVHFWGFCENKVTMKMVISCRPILYVSDNQMYHSMPLFCTFVLFPNNDEKPQRTCTRDLQCLDYLVSISTWKQLRNPHRNTGRFPTRSNQVKFPNSFSTQWLSDVWLSPWKMSSSRGINPKFWISVVEKCWSYNHQQVLIQTIPIDGGLICLDSLWFPIICWLISPLTSSVTS